MVEQSGASSGDLAAAYEEGRRDGLAFAAIALAAASFINLLGVEKSILAAALAILALRGRGTSRAPNQARIALGLAILHLAVAVSIFVIFQHQLIQLVHLLHRLA